jgi:hypothetical protein
MRSQRVGEQAFEAVLVLTNLLAVLAGRWQPGRVWCRAAACDRPRLAVEA